MNEYVYSDNQISLKEIAECLVENLITETTIATQRALVLAEKCSELDPEQKLVFKRICLSLVADKGSIDIIRLGQHYVALHWKDKLNFRNSKFLKKVISTDNYWAILPDPLIGILTLQALLYLAEQSAALRGMAARAQAPLGYSRSVKRPYFRALKSSLEANQRHFPEWFPNIRLLLLRDQRYEIFGWQQTPISRRKKKILSLFRKDFSSGDRVDTISKLQYIIFKAQDAIFTESIAAASIHEVLVYFSNHSKACAALVEDVAALLKKRCVHTYREGLMKAFIMASFSLLKFADENLPEGANLWQRIHFGVNLDLGMAHLASRRGGEAIVFFERSLELLDSICDENYLIRKYLAWFRHFIEGALAQSRREDKIASICLRICLDMLLEVGRLPRFKIPYLSEIRGGRWELVWSAIIHARNRVNVQDEDQLLEFLELQEWSKLIGRDIIQTRQRFDFTVMYVENCLQVAETGVHEMKIGHAKFPRKCNIGEYSLPGVAAMFLQTKQATIETFSKTSAREIKQTYLDFIKDGDSLKKLHGMHSGMAFSALYTYRQLVALGEDQDAEILVIYALENFDFQIRNLSYSFANIVMECFKELASSVAIAKIWREQFLNRLIKLVESIFMHLESIRITILDRDDRAYLEKALQSIYHDITLAFSSILQKVKDPKLAKLLLKAIILYDDRTKLRWLRSVFSDETATEIALLNVPSGVKLEFHAAEQSLRAFYLTHKNRFNPEFHTLNLATKSPSSSRGLTASIGERIEPAPEIDSRINFSQLSQKYIEAVVKIRRIIPDFEGNFLRKILLPMDSVFRRDRDSLKFWVKLLGSRIIFIFGAAKRLRCYLISIETSSEITKICYKSKKVGGLTPKTEEILASLNCSQIRRLAKEVYGGNKAGTKRLMKVFIDSELASLSLEKFIFPDYHFQFIYSPNTSLSSQNSTSKISFESIVIVCSHTSLPLVSLEGQICWRGPRCCGRKYLINEEIDELSDLKKRISCCTVLHFIGHLPADENAKKGYLQYFDGVAIDLQWIAENIHFSKNPVVLLNLCRSGVSFIGDPAVPFLESERYSFDSEFGSEPVSYVSAFLSAGASAVIATTREVEDFAAFLFGWKFSKLAQERETKSVNDVFFDTLKWCRGIRRVADLTAPLAEVEKCYPQADVPRMKSKFHQALNKFLYDFPDTWTNSWDHFVIFR